MRLIDADHLLFLLNSAIELRKKLHRNTSDLDMMVDAVNDEPTAYDPDKVVEQLENERKFWENAYDSNLGKEKARSYEHAIEIVKGECATEQSCEWKLEDLESNLYVTGCENRQLIFEGTPEENGYKYCPYCGRKIKRGGADSN